MNIGLYTYSKVEGCRDEVLRLSARLHPRNDGEIEANACINAEKSHLNLIIADSFYFNSVNAEKRRGECVAILHKNLTGKAPRMKGSEQQMSKAIGVIATLPKNYIDKHVKLTDDEMEQTENALNNKRFKNLDENLKQKLSNVNWTAEEIEEVNTFFRNLTKAIQEELEVPEDCLLYAVVHWDESWPHLHFMGLSCHEIKYEEDQIDKRKKNGTKILHNKGEVRRVISTEKLRENYSKEDNYYFHFHQNVIQKMEERGFDASGLLNGATKKGKFNVENLSKEERMEGVLNQRLKYNYYIKSKEIKRRLAESEFQLYQRYSEDKNRIITLRNVLGKVIDFILKFISSEVEKALKEIEAAANKEERQKILFEKKANFENDTKKEVLEHFPIVKEAHLSAKEEFSVKFKQKLKLMMQETARKDNLDKIFNDIDVMELTVIKYKEIVDRKKKKINDQPTFEDCQEVYESLLLLFEFKLDDLKLDKGVKAKIKDLMIPIIEREEDEFER